MAEAELSLYHQTRPNFRKHYIPLESDPDIFTEVVRNLGVGGYEFQDIISLDANMLDFLPRPVVALILVFPSSDAYDQEVEERERSKMVYQGKGEDEPVIWFAQTIENACGLYAILHALSNGIDKSSIISGSPLDDLLVKSVPLPPHERVLALEASTAIEAVHTAAANKGISRVPDAEEVVDYHYICFVKSQKDRHVYEMNGTSKGPIDTGVVASGDDLLVGQALDLVRNYIGRAGGNVGFSLLGLVPVN